MSAALSPSPQPGQCIGMRRAEQAPRAFQAPVDVHASADGHVYMFPRRTDESAGSSEDEELGAMELRPYHRQSHVHRRGQSLESEPRQGDHLDGQAFLLKRRRDEPASSSEDEELTAMELRPYHRNNHVHSEEHRHGQVLERELQQGDSLNKLALQYGCQVAEIKRLNNLMQEQDLFALKFIKIPLQRHSFLTEEFEDAHTTQNNTPPSPETPLRAPPPVQEVTDFLMEVDNDTERLIQEDEELLEIRDRQGRSGRGQGMKGHGADWGIHWWNAVIAMLLIGIVLPLFYIIYFKTRSSVSGPALNAQSTNSSGTEEATEEPG